MTGRRWPWVAGGVALVAAGLTAGWSTYLHWLPCRGAMLNGSVVRGFSYGSGFSDACLRRMDGGIPFPYPPEPAEQTAWASELGVAATVLTALAWLVLVVGSAWGSRTPRWVAAPGLLILGLAGHAAVAAGRPDRTLDGPMVLWILVELLTVVAVAAILLREPPLDRWATAALVVVAWGSTAFGGSHQMAEYIAMSSFSDANWDVPPGTGYLSAVGLVVAGAFTLAYALRRPGPTARPGPARVTLVDRPA